MMLIWMAAQIHDEIHAHKPTNSFWHIEHTHTQHKKIIQSQIHSLIHTFSKHTHTGSFLTTIFHWWCGKRWRNDYNNVSNWGTTTLSLTHTHTNMCNQNHFSFYRWAPISKWQYGKHYRNRSKTFRWYAKQATNGRGCKAAIHTIRNNWRVYNSTRTGRCQ